MQRHGGSRSGICHTDTCANYHITCANYHIRKSERLLEEREFRQYLRLLQLRWAVKPTCWPPIWRRRACHAH